MSKKSCSLSFECFSHAVLVFPAFKDFRVDIVKGSRGPKHHPKIPSCNLGPPFRKKSRTNFSVKIEIFTLILLDVYSQLDYLQGLVFTNILSPDNFQGISCNVQLGKPVRGT